MIEFLIGYLIFAVVAGATMRICQEEITTWRSQFESGQARPGSVTGLS